MNFLYRIYAAFPGRDNMTAFSKCSSTNTVNLVLDIFMSEKSDARHLMSKKSGTRHRKSGARHLMSEVILELLSTSTNSLRDCILKQAYNTEPIETEQYLLWTSTNISK